MKEVARFLLTVAIVIGAAVALQELEGTNAGYQDYGPDWERDNITRKR